MNKEQQTLFLKTLNKLKSKHIKIDKIEIDEDNNDLKIHVIQMPRGVILNISNDFSGTPGEATECFIKAGNMIKEMATNDLIEWMTEYKVPDNFNGMNLVFEKYVPDNMIMMNHETFIKFRDMTERS